jgi:ketosteroid isomerase-like protein
VGKGQDDAAIKLVLGDWVAAANAGDADAMAALFTDDGILMLPNEPSVIGKEAIRSHLQAHFNECGGAGVPRMTDALYQPSADAPASDEELRFDYRPERGTLPLSERSIDRSDDSLAPAFADDELQSRRRHRSSYGLVPAGWIAKGYLIEKASEEVLELEIAGGWAFARCSYAVTLVPRQGWQPAEDRGKSVRIVKRQSDGTWKVYLDIWNSDQSPPGPGE